MVMKGNLAPQSAEGELAITRVFDAPRDLVWEAWVDPAHVAKWWGPRGFTNPVCEWDARPGGEIHIEMAGPGGMVAPMYGTFHEVVPPERLVFVANALPDEDGNPQLVTRNTITLAERADGKTTLTMRAEVVRATPQAAGALAGMEIGWDQTLDKLGEHLAVK